MRLVVIGGVAAGLSAAARARRVDPGLEIIVLEKGATISYSACGLPYYVEGLVEPLERLVRYTPQSFARERNVEIRTGANVVAIAHPRRQVALAGGERIHYDRLVIATGAAPRREIPGNDLPHVFTLHTLEDARRLETFLREGKPRRAVVIGAGYIGLEAAEAVRAHGARVTILESSANVLHREDPALAERIARHLERFHIELRASTEVRGIHPQGVDDLACDLVVLAAGLKPNAALAADAGVEMGRTGAIRVSEHLETSLSGVYAGGDCAEATHLVTGRPAWVPLGTTANKMGRVAGANAAGKRERFAGIVGTSIVRVCGLGIGLTGLSAAEARRESFQPVEALIEARDRAEYFDGRPVTVGLVADRRTRRLLGGMVLGEHGVAGRINVIATALHARMTLDEFEQLDLAYAPPFAPVWDPLLVAAQQLSRRM